MALPKKQFKKAMDWTRLVLALFAFVAILGHILYNHIGWVYPLNTNLVVTYLLAGYVMLTGWDIYLRKSNQVMGLFLVLCGLITLVLNMVGEVFSK